MIASGLLIGALAVVVIYTSRGALFSPLALVVVAAIGLAALMLQLRLQRGSATGIHAPLWLNLLGVGLALVALFADLLHLSAGMFEIAALGAVGCFSISSVIVLEALRRHRTATK